jgi:hypothetical protein
MSLLCTSDLPQPQQMVLSGTCSHRAGLCSIALWDQYVALSGPLDRQTLHHQIYFFGAI